MSINTLKTLANNGKIKSFKTTGEHRRFRQEDLDAYMGVEKEKQEKLTVIYARCSTAKQKEKALSGLHETLHLIGAYQAKISDEELDSLPKRKHQIIVDPFLIYCDCDCEDKGAL